MRPSSDPDTFHPMAKSPGPVRRWWRQASLKRRLLAVLLVGAVFGTAALVGAWTRACANDACPDINTLEAYDADQTSKVYAADGRLITELGTQRRTVVSLKQMAPIIPEAFLAVEDKRFYQHHGIDWLRFFGAVKTNILHAKVAAGFSTITMQLVGNLWPEDVDRRQRRGVAGVVRKIREAKLALAIEARYPKEKILELYLNQINLGSRSAGVQAASQRYFGKSAAELNVAEAAMLAALPKAPDGYNPRKYPKAAVGRRNTIIELLRDAGKLSAEEAESWKSYPLALSARPDNSIFAEYFVDYVRQQLLAKFGEEIYTRGYEIYTSLDLNAQMAAEQALETQMQRIEADQFGKFPHKSYREFHDARAADAPELRSTPYLQGGALVLEAQTGQILAMVGGRDFNDSKFNRIVQAERQPGSTFKPIVYAAALEAGLTLEDMELDAPISVPIPDQPNWEPKNYDGKFSNSSMTLRQAIWQSTNSIAVKVGLKVGVNAIYDEARKFGITGRVARVPAMVLGSADVRPIEMISAYTTFANLGERVTPIAILRVEDKNGKILYQEKTKRSTVLDGATAFTLAGALRGVVTNGTANSAVYRAGFTIPSGGKTGTTNDYRDVWYIGFTKDLVAGVWMGFDSPQWIMPGAQGGKLAAPAWTQMMLEIYQRRKAPGDWTAPEVRTVTMEIDKTNGLRATPFCPDDVREVRTFPQGQEPKEFCPLHSPFRPGGGPD
jgi:penicillin-binding protein 1A